MKVLFKINLITFFTITLHLLFPLPTVALLTLINTLLSPNISTGFTYNTPIVIGISMLPYLVLSIYLYFIYKGYYNLITSKYLALVILIQNVIAVDYIFRLRYFDLPIQIKIFLSKITIFLFNMGYVSGFIKWFVFLTIFYYVYQLSTKSVKSS
jgi:uncharacterized integral membrane protein